MQNVRNIWFAVSVVAGVNETNDPRKCVVSDFVCLSSRQYIYEIAKDFSKQNVHQQISNKPARETGSQRRGFHANVIIEKEENWENIWRHKCFYESSYSEKATKNICFVCAQVKFDTST